MSVLDDIIVGVREDMNVRMEQVSMEDLYARLEDTPPALDAVSFLRPQGVRGVRIISECKRSSPSKGHLADIADPAALARTYEAGGAAAISVLTEQRRFGGSLEDFDAVRAHVSIPVLRKDFIVDPYQIVEARVHGADMVLLIVAALEQQQLEDYIELAVSLGMTPLVETHTREEAVRAMDAGAYVVGVNARNLKTLDVDRRTFDDVASIIPPALIRVAESGVRGRDDVLEYARSGADVVLVGEALVTSGHPSAAIKELVAVGNGSL